MRVARTITAGGASLLLVLAACGGTTQKSSGGGTDNGPGGTTQKSSGGGADNGPVVAKATAEIESYRVKPTFSPPGPSLEASKVKGKTVYVIPNNLVSDELVGAANGVQQAGEAAGVTVTVFNPNGAVSKMQQGIENAIATKASAIVVLGIPTQFVSDAAASAKQAGIPVVAALNAQPDSNKPGQGAGANFFGYVGIDYFKLGQVMADAAITRAQGKVNASVLSFNNEIARANIDGVKSRLKECSSCKIVGEQDIEPVKWPTDIPGATSSLVRSNPDMNFVMAAVDTMGIFATAGVRQASGAGKVSVISSDGSGPGALGLVKAGDVFIADPGASTGWLGWTILDQSMRAILGMAPGNGIVPFRYIDSSTLNAADPKDEAAIYGEPYKDGFRQLWGLR